MSNIPQLSNIPEVSFIDNRTIANVRDELISDYCREYERITGESITLPGADPIRLLCYAVANVLYQCMQYTDRAGKADLLKYSWGEYLDNLAAMKKIVRKPAMPATVTMRFTLSNIRPSVVGIPGGTRVSTQNGIYFVTNAYTEIPIGAQYVDVSASAEIPGIAANGCVEGTINILVDPIAYISNVQNITTSTGGVDIENDDDLTYRVYMAPSGYSVAGPTEAYEYHARTFRGDIADVRVMTPEPTRVNVYFVLDNGVMPGAQDIADMEEYLSRETIRPLTDQVNAFAPVEKSYNIDLTYYINRSDNVSAVAIQESVNRAITAYIDWQRRIGRDINPSELIRCVRAAGAKRVVLISPEYEVVQENEIPMIAASTVTYGGLEDD